MSRPGSRAEASLSKVADVGCGLCKVCGVETVVSELWWQSEQTSAQTKPGRAPAEDAREGYLERGARTHVAIRRGVPEEGVLGAWGNVGRVVYAAVHAVGDLEVVHDRLREPVVGSTPDSVAELAASNDVFDEDFAVCPRCAGTGQVVSVSIAVAARRTGRERTFVVEGHDRTTVGVTTKDPAKSLISRRTKLISAV